MIKRTILLVLLVGLFWAVRLEGGGRAHFGANGSAHLGSRRNAGFRAGVRSYRGDFGYRPRGCCSLSFGLRYPRSGYRSRFYFPGYYVCGYDSYVATTPGANGPIPGYDEDSQPYYTKTRVLNQKIDCKDTWTGGGNTGSLSGTMTRVLEFQCENRHTGSTSESESPPKEGSTRQIP